MKGSQFQTTGYSRLTTVCNGGLSKRRPLCCLGVADVNDRKLQLGNQLSNIVLRRRKFSPSVFFESTSTKNQLFFLGLQLQNTLKEGNDCRTVAASLLYRYKKLCDKTASITFHAMSVDNCLSSTRAKIREHRGSTPRR